MLRYRFTSFPQTGGDNPIFPPLDTVRELRDLDGVNTALHFCGKYTRMAAREMRATWPVRLKARGFGRVQINLHGEARDPGRVPVTGAVQRCAEET